MVSSIFWKDVTGKNDQDGNFPLDQEHILEDVNMLSYLWKA